MSEKLKLCIDCRHCEESPGGTCLDFVCTSPGDDRVSPVTGKDMPRYCTSARIWPCGIEARLFAPKSSAPVDAHTERTG